MLEAVHVAEEVGLDFFGFGEHHTRETGMAEMGRSGPPPLGRAASYERDGMVFVGGPNEVADRILHLPELLGTEVLPQIRKELEQP